MLMRPLPAAARRRALLQAGAALLGAGAWPVLAADKTRGVPSSPPLLSPQVLQSPLLSLAALRRRVLANGLECLSLPTEGSTVSVQVWYRVGGKDDPPGRSGFAHLFEHMMFKRTRYMANEQFDRMTEDVGGSNNAFTADDMTAYHCVVPANHLEPVLWAEAERMSNLTVDQANFDSEREVVKEEFRQTGLADPYGPLFNAVPGLGYQRHPYRRPVIGSIEDLDAATLRDVNDFHASYYRPDNAVLIVVGGFEAPGLDAAVDRYFGSIRRPSTPIPRETVAEPRRLRDETHHLPAPNAPAPAALLIWQGPKAGSADAGAWQLAQALLSLGESSRLSEALVFKKAIAQSVGFEAQLNAEAGLLVAHAMAAPGRSAASLVQPLAREIQRLAEEPISPEVLNKAKTQLLTAALIKRQTPQGLGEVLGSAALLRGEAWAAQSELLELQALTAAAVQAVVRRDVLGGARVTVLYGDSVSPAAGRT
ncbi:M16 family metallopeptidase [Paucibacter sp. Y2R2-4]|uniref:M16 family metallopeptidase n=1 Tax=Paucibacter sp. Y2R2-4 TaxID=2893553 RepID=UPI0021E4EC0E|nr:pitrilysin family protein [Paucibacter sp. Y2R2-4]MCV2351679.1 insulinase family protein [Paucibacter sp. Y2R2-4]